MKTSKLTCRVRTWLEKVAPGPDLHANAKKRSQRVSSAAKSGEKAKSYADDTAGIRQGWLWEPLRSHERFCYRDALLYRAKCSSCTLHQLESASYWLAQIHLAMFLRKHFVSMAFFRLVFQCQDHMRDKLCDSNSRCSSMWWLRMHVKHYHFFTVSLYFYCFELV